MLKSALPLLAMPSVPMQHMMHSVSVIFATTNSVVPGMEKAQKAPPLLIIPGHPPRLLFFSASSQYDPSFFRHSPIKSGCAWSCHNMSRLLEPSSQSLIPFIFHTAASNTDGPSSIWLKEGMCLISLCRRIIEVSKLTDGAIKYHSIDYWNRWGRVSSVLASQCCWCGDVNGESGDSSYREGYIFVFFNIETSWPGYGSHRVCCLSKCYQHGKEYCNPE